MTMRPQRLVTTLALLLATGITARAAADSALQHFSEKQVAGTDKDFMIVRHLTMRGSNEAIGKKLAEIAATRHGFELSADTSEQTKKRWAFYKKYYPNHFTRSAGVADYFGAPAGGPVDTTALWYNMNLAPACSVVHYPPAYTSSGHAVLSRNYDFSAETYAEMRGVEPPHGMRPWTADPYVIEVYPDQGFASLYVCAYDLLGGCLDGVNEKGLTVALLSNHDPFGVTQPAPSKTPRAGLSEIELTRFVLDRCATVAEARTLLETVPVYYSMMPCHYIIGDRTGASVVFEYSTDLEERHLTDGRGAPQVITNHPVHQYEADGKKKLTSGDSFNRFRTLESQIAATPKTRTTDDIKKTNACVKARSSAGQRVPGLPARLNRTFWHSLYDCTDGSMEVDFYLGEDPSAPGGERRSGYLKFKLDNTATAKANDRQG